MPPSPGPATTAATATATARTTATATNAATTGDRDDKWDHGHHDKHHGGGNDIKVDIDFYSGRTYVRPRYHERRVRYWVEPQYKVVSERVWVEPVYRPVSERVWVEPVYKTVYEDVYTPARYEVREIVRYSHGRKIITRERTLIEPACTKRVPRQLCVTPGHFDVVTKQVCVTPGRWNVVERRVCVSEGRWDYRVERVEITAARKRRVWTYGSKQDAHASHERGEDEGHGEKPCPFRVCMRRSPVLGSGRTPRQYGPRMCGATRSA